MSLLAGARNSQRVNTGQQFALADDFYLIGLDDRTSRPRLHAKAMSLGTAAALLSELVLANYIRVTAGRFEVAYRYRRAPEPELATMMDVIIAEPHHTMPTWLAYFAQTSTDVVLERLVKSGFLREESSKGLLRSKSTYMPTDQSALSWRSLRIAHVINKRDVRTWEDLALIGLLVATRLTDFVLWNADPTDRESLKVILGGLNDEPSLHALISQVEALIAAAVLAQRK